MHNALGTKMSHCHELLKADSHDRTLREPYSWQESRRLVSAGTYRSYELEFIRFSTYAPLIRIWEEYRRGSNVRPGLRFRWF